jgi:hypothetical protein
MKRHNLCDAVSDDVVSKRSRLSYDLKTSSYSKYGTQPSAAVAMMESARGQHSEDDELDDYSSHLVAGI